MKLNKKIQQIILAFILVAVVFTSCKKYLDVEPKTIAGNAAVVFSHPDSVQKVIISIYDPLQGDYGYGDRLSIYFPYDDDIMAASSVASDQTRGFFNHFNIFTPYENQLIKNPWIWFFTGVERANIACFYIPKMDMYTNGTTGQKDSLKQFYGEALTLRAWYYSELVKFWGDVPTSFLPAAETPDLYAPRTNRYVVYDQILKDLELAGELLPWKSATLPSDRVSKGFAKALRARIALFAGGYSLNQDGTKYRPADYLEYYKIAKKETGDLMANRAVHNLNPSFRSVFKDALCAHLYEPNGEIIFEVSHRFSGGKTGSKLGYDCGPRMTGGNNRGNCFIRVLPTYFYMFDSTDERRDVTVAPYNITLTTGVKVPQTFVGEIADGKFRKDWIKNPTPAIDGSNGQNFGLNFPLMRFSDVLLMYAEAENELNGPAGALAALNEVRNRAHAPAVNPSSKADMFNAIVKERALELGGEAIRKYDLIRWDLLETKLKETKNTLDMIARGITFPDLYSIPSPYDTLPRVMYLKDGGANGLITANSFYHPYKSSDPAPSGSTGFTKVNWISSLASSTTPGVSAANPNGLHALLCNYALGNLTVGNGFGFVTGKHEHLPIPTSAITTNPNIVQNFGY